MEVCQDYSLRATTLTYRFRFYQTQFALSKQGQELKLFSAQHNLTFIVTSDGKLDKIVDFVGTGVQHTVVCLTARIDVGVKCT